MTATMQAVHFYAPKDIRLVEVPVPEPGPGEALLKIEAALTCGTDFKAFRRGHAVMLPHPPCPFGHEAAGVIAKLGRGAEKLFSEGQRVTVGDSAPCETCFFCRNGQSPLCDNLKILCGAYAQYLLVPAGVLKHKTAAIPDTLDFSAAALAEPLACAVHAVQALAVSRGETAAVVGAGPMALMLIQVLKAAGARVLVLGRSPENLARAQAAGADQAFSALAQNGVLSARQAADGRGADAVFEAAGSPEAWQNAFALARKGGRVCFFGGCAPNTQVPLDAHRVHYEELSLRGVFHHAPEHFHAAAALLAQGKIKTELLISGRVALSELPKFFQDNAERSIPKAAVIP
ncbi:MAG TPA: zinc-binding dehydrogenase [Elusimicrobiota bacterium]|nr:zinc-binding dehydrogenase [Elusimicrobiota bacterium]